jgi:cytochrome c-type protein NapC
MSVLDKPAARPSLLRRVRNFVLELWGVLIRPSSVFGLGVLVLAGFAAGVIFWGGFNTALELTNTEKFCTGCHEMRDNVFAELKSTVHFTNRSGVRATCPDCHVPHNWTDKIARKMQASKEVWGHLFGFIDTHEKFVDKRLGAIDGHHQAVAARVRRPRTLPVPGREDLHRLPQGHCAPPARHARRSRLAVDLSRLALTA